MHATRTTPLRERMRQELQLAGTLRVAPARRRKPLSLVRGRCSVLSLSHLQGSSNVCGQM